MTRRRSCSLIGMIHEEGGEGGEDLLLLLLDRDEGGRHINEEGEELVSVLLRLGCVHLSPGSLDVPCHLRAEGDKADKRVRPHHEERTSLDNEAVCRNVARSVH